MLRGRTKLPVLAEISGPPEGSRAWSLRRADFEALEKALPRVAGQRVVLVSGDREAAPVAAIALAAAASASGRRTILVECDLAQPHLAAHIGLAAAPGLHEYLRWEAEPADVLQPVALAGPAAAGAIEPLVCICGGRPATKAETLLGLQSFSHMVEKLRGAYELVLVLAPPAVSEPGSCLAVAGQADAVLAGLPAAEAKGRAGRAVRTAIRRLPTPALGAIAVHT
jgi:Mrp family chromosome partitioning ATPase